MAHGPEAVHELIEESELTYPVSATRLEREYALANIEIDEAGNSIMLSELLLKADIDRFEDYEDLCQKLEPVFDDESSTRQTSIIDKVKKYLLGSRKQ